MSSLSLNYFELWSNMLMTNLLTHLYSVYTRMDTQHIYIDPDCMEFT